MLFKQVNPIFFKFKSYSILYLCFYNAICIGFDDVSVHFPAETFAKNDERLLAADEFLAAGLFERAIDLYQDILKVEKNGTEVDQYDSMKLQTAMQTRLHLAQALLVTKKNQEDALHLLRCNIDETHSLKPGLEIIRQNSIYLTALIYKQTSRLNEALDMMERYLSDSKDHNQNLRQAAQFEIAHINFLKGNLEQAFKLFETLEVRSSSPQAILRELYLARIQLTKGDFPLVISTLKKLSQQLDPDDHLQYEVSYFLGEASFRMHAYQEALKYFEQALPKHMPENSSWFGETLYLQGLSYLNLANLQTKDWEVKSDYFNKAEASFIKLLTHQPNEKSYLSLGQSYLARAKQLQDAQAYAKAEEILSQKEHFTSIAAQTQALLLRAEAAPLYSLRNTLYQQIIETAATKHDEVFYGKAWFLYALNDYEEGQKRIKSENSASGRQILAKSAVSFENAFNLLKNHDKVQAVEAIKHQALALSQIDRESVILAYQIIDELIEKHPDLLHDLEFPDEIYYLRGIFGLRLADTQNKYISLAEQSLQQAAQKGNKFGDRALNELAAWHYRLGNFLEAEKVYLQLIKDFPDSPYQPEAWLWSAYCTDQLQSEPDVARQRRVYLLEHYPQSSVAAEAYFTMYSYRDYLQGDRNAMKHLQYFAKKYPESPYLMQAYYLIGLDFKRNRKSPEGKWIRKKSLNDAIDAFQKGESLFENLMDKVLISDDKIDFYTNVYYRIILERAMANLAIADESEGAKQQIYLEYAEEVLKNLLASFNLQQSPYVKRLMRSDTYPALYEESAFWLAQTYVKQQKDVEAERLLSTLLEKYQQDKIINGYYLSRIKYEQGKIAMRHQDPLRALEAFKKSEEAAKGNLLATNEKLDLWIQQSYCYRDLKQYDDAILVLSKVANDDAISSLRLKAMFLRADIYELQGRPELARKQLEWLAKKGGNWALKAREKLEKNYGY